MEKPHNDELHNLYRSPNIVKVIICRRLRWADRVARMEEGSSDFKLLIYKPITKRPVGRPRCRWEMRILECILKKYRSYR